MIDAGVRSIVATPQVIGNADKGRDYLLHGDFIGSGLPLQLFRLLDPPDPEQGSEIPRRGNADLFSLDLNAFEMPTGVEVVAGVTCLGCHGSTFNGEFIVGLGNTSMEWASAGSRFPSAEIRGLAAVAGYPPGSPGWEALTQYLRGVDAVHGRVDTPFRGVNPAFRLEEVAAAHRVPSTLKWSQRRVYPVPDRVVASAVPAWWNLKKKNALYYTGSGRGDFGKLIQQINVVAIEDAEDAARINTHMADLLAFIKTIEPPPYPHAINEELAAAGRLVFASNCAECHGTYAWGDDPSWTYPNKLVPVDIVGTDPEYARVQVESGLSRWFNASWYARTEPFARSEPSMAYIAPPLDGIWITAPYLHNDSVPTLEALLDSTKRPTYWRRSFRDDDYNFNTVGWNYQTIPVDEQARPTRPLDRNTYDTTIPGYGNQGHDYGDHLSDTERRALIEYLKTL